MAENEEKLSPSCPQKTPKNCSAIQDLLDLDNLKSFSKTNKIPVTISVQNLTYSVPLQKTRLPFPAKNHTPDSEIILNNVSFDTQPGRFLAIMGGSGSGKTSLLDVITDRVVEGTIDPQTKILLGGEPATQNHIKHLIGYVTQDDRLLPNLTVRETLIYSAFLKLSARLSKREKIRRVDAILGELGLTHVANSSIGSATKRGISGGERRRVTIGCQLITDPSILFLDEPTTGLDSFTAFSIVATLRALAFHSNRTVICTIHQPRSEVFELLDLILLLSAGHVSYFGDKNSLIPYFASFGFTCPSLVNPSEYFLDLTTIDYRDIERENATQQTIQLLITHYQNSSPHQRFQPQNLAPLLITASPPPSPDSVPILLDTFAAHQKPLSRFQQFVVLYIRATRNITKDVGGFCIHCLEALVMGFIIGLIFFHLGHDQNSIRDRLGLFFVVTTLYCFMLILGFIVKFNEERPTFYRERRDACYHLLPYLASQLLSELPFVCFTCLLYSLPIFFMAALTSSNDGFGMFFIINLLLTYVSRSLALISCSLFADIKNSVFFANVFYSLFVFSGGFIVNINNIFPAVAWISQFCFIRRGIEALAINEFTNMNFSCNAPPNSCIDTGQQALQFYHLNSSSLSINLSILLANIIVMRIISYLFLRFKNQRPLS